MVAITAAGEERTPPCRVLGAESCSTNEALDASLSLVERMEAEGSLEEDRSGFCFSTPQQGGVSRKWDNGSSSSILCGGTPQLVLGFLRPRSCLLYGALRAADKALSTSRMAISTVSIASSCMAAASSSCRTVGVHGEAHFPFGVASVVVLRRVTETGEEHTAVSDIPRVFDVTPALA